MNPDKPDTSMFKHTFGTDTTSDGQNDIIVLKIGSSSITSADGHMQLANLGRFIEFAHDLRAMGKKVVIVSSGAVSVGVTHLQLESRPSTLVVKQACAAVGQSRLMALYDSLFGVYNMKVAQVLLTRDNINNEFHYLNAINTIEQLIEMDIVPIINENDSISVYKLKIGDNDSLAGMVACMLKARHLFLLTDVSSLYTADPRTDPTATPIHTVHDIQPILELFAATPTMQSGKWGTGGFATKVTAAHLAAACGVHTSVLSSNELPNIITILNGSYTVGTTFFPSPNPLVGRKKFLYVGMITSGEIYIDQQAASLFTQPGQTRSYDLLPSGVLFCTEGIVPGSCVNIVVADESYLRQVYGKAYPKSASIASQDSDSESNVVTTAISSPDNGIKPGLVIGRGISNFSTEEILKIRGLHSTQICDALDTSPGCRCVIDSDNFAVHYHQ